MNLALNGTEAAKRGGYEPKTAHATASRLLKKARVQALIAELTEKKIEKLDISAERIPQELARLGFSNMLYYLVPQEDGSRFL